MKEDRYRKVQMKAGREGGRKEETREGRKGKRNKGRKKRKKEKEGPKL